MRDPQTIIKWHVARATVRIESIAWYVAASAIAERPSLQGRTRAA